MKIEDLILAEEITESAKARIPVRTIKRLLSGVTVTRPVVLELALSGPHSLKLIREGTELYLSATGLVTGRFGEFPITVSL